MSEEERSKEDREEMRRWHAEVRAELFKIHAALSELASAENPLQRRVRRLEDTRAQLIGALVLVQFLMMLAAKYMLGK